MNMRNSKLVMLLIGLVMISMLAGCASKGYVDKTMAEEKARTDAEISRLDGEVASNREATNQLQSLTSQLEKKTDMALNQAKGFESYQVIWEGEIYFDFNSTAISVAAQDILDQGGEAMTQHPESVMEFSGFTDPTGPQGYNMELGRKRAEAAKFYLVDNYGINLFRMFTASYGETKAVDVGDNQSSFSQMRKTKMRLWGRP